MTDYLRAVIDMIGPPENRYADPAAWARLEAELDMALPTDYKTLVDAYAPIQINGHLSLSHPATEWWNLGEEIRIRRVTGHGRPGSATGRTTPSPTRVSSADCRTWSSASGAVWSR